jgi:hypothetical protein
MTSAQEEWTGIELSGSVLSEVYGSEPRLFVMDIPLLDDADDVGWVMTGF